MASLRSHLQTVAYSNIEPRSMIAYTAFAILTICVARYAVTVAIYNKAVRDEGHRRSPPVLPYYIPFVGHFPWQYFWSPMKFFTSSYYAVLQQPVRIRLFTKELYIIQGQKNVVAHLAQTSTSNTIFNASFLRQACAMSDSAVERLGSETEETPKHFERKYLAAAPLYAWSSSVIHRYLVGRSAMKLSQKFTTNLQARIRAHPALIVSEGIMLDDFRDFFINDVTAALLDAMCGTGLLERTPSFIHAFGIFCDNLPTYMKGMPRLLAREAYTARDDALEAVVNWQTWASENFDANSTPLDEDGDDAFWGSKFFRERFSTFVHDMGFDARDIAAMELGFLFGASANVTVNTYWCAIDVFKDTELLNEVRRDVEACKVNGQFDINKLIQQPLLQAVFAESLRLRTHNMFIRKTTEDISIMDWVIPKNRFVVAWSTPVHMDAKIWSDANNTHPVDTFWPGRFLKQDDKSNAAQFSFRGEGSWLPFGSGANLCPGMHFAKVHCIMTLAMMVDAFDCDILAGRKAMELDLSKFGMGVLGPNGKVPVRLRRKKSRD